MQEKFVPRAGAVLVNIDVSDVERARQFYATALSLRIARRLGPTIVELLGENTALYLIEKPQGSAPFPDASSGRDYQRHWTPVHLDFVVSDLDAAMARALTAGAKQHGEPTDNEWGKLALFSDPWGNGFCLIEFTLAGYDAIAT